MEALGNRPSSIIIDIAAIVVDITSDFTFSTLLKSTENMFYRKINIRQGQPNRTTDTQTLEWWAKQSPEAKAVLKQSSDDVLLVDALNDFKQFLLDVRFNIKYDFAYCRGQSYDFPLIAHAADQLCDTWGLGYSMFPCAFYHQRDIRTAIAHTLLKPDLKKMPVPIGAMNGFVKHNAIHDCCKDAYLLKLALDYAKGKEIPDEYDLL